MINIILMINIVVAVILLAINKDCSEFGKDLESQLDRELRLREFQN